MIEPLRLLAFAFAGADLLFEIDAKGNVLFAMGASSGFSATPDITGRSAAELFAPAEKLRFINAVQEMTPGGRGGPLTMTLVSGEKATLWMCCLSDADRISCTLVKPNNRAALPSGGTDTETGLSDKNAFLAAASKATGGKGAIALVNVPALANVCGGMNAKDSAALMTAIGTRMNSMGALVAARLSKTGFGVVANDEKTAQGLTAQLHEAFRENGIADIKTDEVTVSLAGGNLTAEQNILALRHVVGRFAQGNLTPPPGSDLANVFEKMMSETLEKAQSFNSTVARGAFHFVYEPIVDLKTNLPSHYEALTRFEADKSPADLICFAEHLGLSASFDLAVAVKAFETLERNPAILASIAINLSGPSISSSASFATLYALFAKKRMLSKRILIEITETAEITDLTSANKAIKSLQKMGYRVGIDDFGSGSASLQYLQGLDVNFVKFDGALIRRLGQSPKEDALLKSVVASCIGLGIETIAEWIDSKERLQACKEMGFRYGQGRHFGDALKDLPTDAAGAAVSGRRFVAR
ncbi:MAG: EAL domain-containing protein [Alphaproteobacteria bacterium]|nr:EAL domain-containing protein [Alphaproteobacteria bacterium]